MNTKGFNVNNLKTLIGIFILCSANLILAQNSATSEVITSIVQPIGIRTSSELNFATINTRMGGEITITPSNTSIATGEVIIASEDKASPATIELNSEPGIAYAVTLPTINYIIYNGTDSMTINNFTSDYNNDFSLSDGSQTLHVGATLIINSHQTPGYYTNTTGIHVAISYN